MLPPTTWTRQSLPGTYVLVALPDAAPGEIDRLLAMRRSEVTSPGFGGVDSYLSQSQARVVSIRAVCETDSGLEPIGAASSASPGRPSTLG